MFLKFLGFKARVFMCLLTEIPERRCAIATMWSLWWCTVYWPCRYNHGFYFFYEESTNKSTRFTISSGEIVIAETISGLQLFSPSQGFYFNNRVSKSSPWLLGCVSLVTQLSHSTMPCMYHFCFEEVEKLKDKEMLWNWLMTTFSKSEKWA